tara:strand:- start:5 stop:1768 length:1764 start_codon:yes stop_codon:yes gene_type:complete
MNKKTNNIFNSIIRLWPFIKKDKKYRIYIYAFLTIISAFADLVSIGAIVPFIIVFTDPIQLNDIEFFVLVKNYFEINTTEEIQTFLFSCFSLAVIFAGLIKVSLSWYQSRLAYGVAADIGNMVFSSALSKPYDYHLRKNSNEIISTIANKANIVADNIIHPLLSFLLAFVTVVAIGSLLFYINPYVTFLVFSLIFSVYVLIVKATKKHIQKASIEINNNFDTVMRIIREGLEGIRYVILTSSKNIFVKAHRLSETTLRTGQANISFASIFPRSVIETFALLVFAWIVFIFIDTSEGSSELISLMGAIVMAIQRLLPVLQQAYFGWTKLSGAKAIIEDTLIYIEQSEILDESNIAINVDKLPFKKSINLKDLSFSYDGNDDKAILKNINLEIPRASKIGITGVSGSGKSTLIDLIMGFLKPTKGKILVDDIELNFDKNKDSWQKNISLVPQNIYLADTTIASNIAFGEEKENINFKKISEIIQITQLDDFVSKIENGINYVVGEDGKNLSFGQKQRIAIARALYRNTELLVIDEGTSALDKKTQANVINALNELENKPAIIMIAHRIEILENYDVIYHLEDGILKELN